MSNQEMNNLEMTITPVSYFIAINCLAFALYGIDKQKARKGRWRISEKTLLCIAIAGGSLGALLGMHIFRHKTRHPQFRFGLPIILIIQLALAFFIYIKLM